MSTVQPPPAGPEPSGRNDEVLLSGPTGSGKSAVAVALAERLSGEIVSVDSMQVYRGLDLGTAKPTAAERARTPHHLLDLVAPWEPFDTARWLEAAKRVVAEIRGRGRIPILCGGTGLYFKAWLGGLDHPTASSPELRRELEARSLEDLVEELKGRNPAAAAGIDLRNPRRVIRALEILRLGGCLPQIGAGRGVEGGARVWALQRAPDDLRRRIDERVAAMFRAGWVEEVRGLLERGLGAERTAMQAIGYRQVVEHLRGERDLPSTMALVASRTWQYVRRQRTWLRHQLPVAWVEVGAEERPEVTADRILQGIRG